MANVRNFGKAVSRAITEKQRAEMHTRDVVSEIEIDLLQPLGYRAVKIESTKRGAKKRKSA